MQQSNWILFQILLCWARFFAWHVTKHLYIEIHLNDLECYPWRKQWTQFSTIHAACSFAFAANLRCPVEKELLRASASQKTFWPFPPAGFCRESIRWLGILPPPKQLVQKADSVLAGLKKNWNHDSSLTKTPRTWGTQGRGGSLYVISVFVAAAFLWVPVGNQQRFLLLEICWNLVIGQTCALYASCKTSWTHASVPGGTFLIWDSLSNGCFWMFLTRPFLWSVSATTSGSKQRATLWFLLLLHTHTHTHTPEGRKILARTLLRPFGKLQV